MNLLTKSWKILTPKNHKQLLLYAIFTVIIAFFEAVSIGLLLPFISFISDPNSLSQFSFIEKFLNYFGAVNFNQKLTVFSLVILFLFIFKNILRFGVIYFQNSFIQNNTAFHSVRLLRNYIFCPYTFHLQKNSAELLRNVNIEVQIMISHVITRYIVIFTDGLTVLSLLILLIFVQPYVALASTFCVGLLSLAFPAIFGKMLESRGKKMQDLRNDIIRWVNQSIGGIKETKVLNREDFFLKSFKQHNYAYAKNAIKVNIINEIPRVAFETAIVIIVVVFCMLSFAAGNTAAKLLSVVGIFAAAAFRIMPAAQKIVTSINMIKTYGSSVELLYNDLVLMEKNLVFKTDSIQKISGDRSFYKKIEFRDVSYKYPSSDKTILKNINISIPRGKSVAFIGGSGEGKTTLIDVLLGLLTPTNGQILVDSENIHHKLSSWQKIIGYIPQFIYLSDDSVRRNVAFGINDEEIDDSQVWKCLEDAQLRCVVEELPEKLDTFVGEFGVRLSGGQRQRIGIARALYHNPEVLILDEATSSLDYSTEREIIKTLEMFRGEKTLIIITHRLKTVENCDIKYHLDKGKIDKKEMDIWN